ncbi:MAG TPA: hypothetical protein VG476_02415 [Acidimicrobiales bacterium]|nr:hypothetical protein [Acidimicrobiales bacterium]
MGAPRIAVVGWGSLIWDPRQLPLSSSWQPDGPELPVEFARVSRDGRLTLALRDGVGAVQTLWAITSCASLDEARDQLARRERTDATRIGSLDCHGDGRVESLDAVHRRSLPRLASWLADRDLEGVVWTGLPSNFEEQTGDSLDEDAAVRYAAQLSGETRHVAEQYVRRAPAQVRTTIRAGLERELGWTAAEA